MKIAVCVKYVPVLSRIQFDYEKKTIIREGVPSEINPFDLLGLVRAVQLKTSAEDQVMAISMGPPNAREGLVQCLALGADRGVLVSDRALAGSDTLATARALALALDREKPDLIICGRNSADAETGQVGPPGKWSIHLAATNGAGGGGDDNRSKQVSLLTVRRLGKWRIGLSASNNLPQGARVRQTGMLGGFHSGRLSLLAEADWREASSGTGDSRSPVG